MRTTLFLISKINFLLHSITNPSEIGTTELMFHTIQKITYQLDFRTNNATMGPRKRHLFIIAPNTITQFHAHK